MPDQLYSGPRPTVEFVLCLVAALFMVVDGVVLEYYQGVVSARGFTNFGGWLGGLGVLELLLAFVILVLSIFMYRDPVAHRGYGVVIAILSGVSIVGGGGFGIGLVLGVVGGVLGNQFVPDRDRLWHGSPPGVGWTPSWSPGSSVPPPPLYAPWAGTPDRRCPNCGWSGLPTARFCPSCGARLG